MRVMDEGNTHSFCRINVLVMVLIVAKESMARESGGFNYGWKFFDGDDPSITPMQPVCTVFDTHNQVDCTDLEKNPNRFSPSDCASSCCYASGCRVWLWNNSNIPKCFHGNASSVCTRNPKSNSVGGARASSSSLRSDMAFSRGLNLREHDSGYDDSGWRIVDVPHDSIINSSYSAFADHLHGHLQRSVSWYRKHFVLPAEWRGSSVVLHFEGVFHFAMLWLNGQFLQTHSCGYTGFTVRLDNVSSVAWGRENVLAVRADATYGSGHWYEGGGIYRPVHLIHLQPLHFVHNGIFVDPQPRGEHIFASAELQNLHASEPSMARVAISLIDVHGMTVATNSTPVLSVQAGALLKPVPLFLSSASVQLWSVSKPVLYTVQVLLLEKAIHSHEYLISDAMNISSGFRSLNWTSDHGLLVKNENVKLQGFSNHDSFAGVGTAVPDRVNLFRVQTLRALGANIWRMSHNPYSTSLYRLLDTVGLLAWDESRDFSLVYVNDMEVHPILHLHMISTDAAVACTGHGQTGPKPCMCGCLEHVQRVRMLSSPNECYTDGVSQGHQKPRRHKTLCCEHQNRVFLCRR